MAAGTLRAWVRDGSDDNPEELHQTEPPEFLTQEEVFLKTGVTYWREERYGDKKRLDELKAEGGFQTADFLELSGDECGDDFKKMSSVEHLHDDQEVRLVVSGAIFFEVRDLSGRWLRLHLREGDLITLPPGIYHRGMLDKQKHCKLYRLFSDLTEWKAYFKPEADARPVRLNYLREMNATS